MDAKQQAYPTAHCWLCAADSAKINIYATHYACYKKKVQKVLWRAYDTYFPLGPYGT